MLYVYTYRQNAVRDEMKVTLSITECVWLNYKAECVRRKLTPSAEIEAFMLQRLAAWDVGPQQQGCEISTAKDGVATDNDG